MYFLKEIRDHLEDFETEVSDEIHRFIDFLHTKYGEVQPAVVPPPNPIGNYVPSTYDIPVVAPPPKDKPEEEPADPIEVTLPVDPQEVVPTPMVVSNDTPDPNVTPAVVAPAPDSKEI